VTYGELNESKMQYHFYPKNSHFHVHSSAPDLSKVKCLTTSILTHVNKVTPA